MIAIVASCSKNEVIDGPTAKKQEISFSNLNDKVSAHTKVTNTLDYTVYAQYSTFTDNITNVWYINSEEISAKDNTGTNSYFWPEKALDFYAFTPQTIIPTATEPTVSAKGKLDITYTVTNENAKIDFAIATPSIDQTPNSSGNGKVTFVFKHMLSKVMINATLNADLIAAGYKLNLAGKTKFTVVNNKGVVDATDATLALTTSVDGTALTYSSDNIATGITESTAIPFLIIPHLANEKCTVEITGVTLTHPSMPTIAVVLKHEFADQAFAAGSQYNLKFTVNQKKITFSSEMDEWGTATDVPTPPAV